MVLHIILLLLFRCTALHKCRISVSNPSLMRSNKINAKLNSTATIKFPTMVFRCATVFMFCWVLFWSPSLVSKCAKYFPTLGCISPIILSIKFSAFFVPSNCRPLTTAKIYYPNKSSWSSCDDGFMFSDFLRTHGAVVVAVVAVVANWLLGVSELCLIMTWRWEII